jgi:hypothetical protein
MPRKTNTPKKAVKTPSKAAKGKDARVGAAPSGPPGGGGGAAVAPKIDEEVEEILGHAEGFSLAFRVGSWKGLPNYECVECDHATLDLDVATSHYEAEHALPVPPPPRIIDTGLVDADGAPIQRDEPAKEE